MINIVLHEPEIPYNTGNIGRTCVITGASLHLIRPYGFFLNDKMIKRAGLDYWPKLNLHEHDSTEEFYAYYDSIIKEINDSKETEKRTPRIFYATTKGKHRYTDVEFHDGDFIMFGHESAGIPEEILAEHPEDCIRIPMMPEERSLNLSNSAAIAVYEVFRQHGFPSLDPEGRPATFSWEEMQS